MKKYFNNLKNNKIFNRLKNNQISDKLKNNKIVVKLSNSKILGGLISHQVVFCILLAFAINLIIEMFGRKSVFLGINHLVFVTHIFAYNMMIIFATLLISFLFNRRYFVMMIVSACWLFLGITNRVLLSYRTTPLGAIDFKIVKSAFSIMNIYLNVFEIILIIAATILTIVVIIYTWRKVPKIKPHYVKATIGVAGTFLLVLFSTHMLLQKDVLTTTFTNLPNAYRDYGFVYCFTSTLVDTGIDKPEDYSKDAINEILTEIKVEEDDNANGDIIDIDSINKDEYQATTKEPNILFLQLESFFDVNYMKNLSYSEDPVPTFTHLKDKYSSGFLTVPSVGAGTANTEFEVITGMSLEFFGPGEYPYKTILQSSTCETVNYNLKELGYSTHAIHNHSGSFYDRNIVYSQLGFDTFTSKEYMNNVEFNPIGWAKDSILTSEIMKTLNSTKGRDCVYTISVQGHGKYPSAVVDENQKITIHGLEDEQKIAYEYFVNQLNSMDEFIGALISTLETFNEPTILVMFGDHLPSFEISNEDLENNDIYQTEYIIWDNIGLEKVRKDMHSYQLTSYLLNRIGITNGVLTKFHNNNILKENYKHELEMLEHDMLYGEKAIYNGVNPYEPTELKMGISDIKIDTVSVIKDSAYLIGDNFTEWSQVYINGKKQETTYINKNIIKALDVDLESEDVITVNQVGDDRFVLSTSKEYIYK